MKKTPLTRKTKLRHKSKSETALLKEAIQAELRRIVIARDGGCILRNLPMNIRHQYGVHSCNGYRRDGELILQADHLIGRSNSGTYADSRLVVCVCKGHHGWKSVGNNLRKKQYDAIVRTLLPKNRVELWDKAEQDSWRPVRRSASDWKLEFIALQQQ